MGFRLPKPTGSSAPAEPDAYQQYRADEQARAMAALVQAQPQGSTAANGFQLSEPFAGPNPLAAEQQTMSPGSLSMSNVYDPSAAVGSAAEGVSAGDMAGAGIGAAGQTATIIAQVAAAKAAKDSMLANNAASRASSEKMARAALAQSASQANASAKMSAYEQMLASLNQATKQTEQQRALNRSISKSRGDGLTTAFLGA